MPSESSLPQREPAPTSANLTATIAAYIATERARQDAKFGPQRHLPAELWMTILGEEYGEACKAALDSRPQHTTGYATREDLIDELVQVAAVAVAALEDLLSQPEPEPCPHTHTAEANCEDARHLWCIDCRTEVQGDPATCYHTFRRDDLDGEDCVCIRCGRWVPPDAGWAVQP